MSLPKVVFLDTSVFAGQQYNYLSAVLSSFVAVAKKSEIKLLLPDPTVREIKRQIRERSNDALKALEDARRKAPFLSKWKHFPPKQTSLHEWEVRRVAEKEWHEFLKQFQTETLGYDGVSIPRVMSWYDSIRAPFGEGKKRKEFPDAFAIEIVSIYAEKNEICVAVVSDDNDIKKACEHYPSLLYFPSLSQLTELLLLDEAKVNFMRDMVDESIELIESSVGTKIEDFSSYVYDDRFEVDEESVYSPHITEIRIVGLGHNECTVVFDAEFDSEHRLKWEEVVDPSEGYTESHKEWVSQTNNISGTAKLAIDYASKKISAVVMLELYQSEIEVQRTPRWY